MDSVKITDFAENECFNNSSSDEFDEEDDEPSMDNEILNHAVVWAFMENLGHLSFYEKVALFTYQPINTLPFYQDHDDKALNTLVITFIFVRYLCLLASLCKLLEPDPETVTQVFDDVMSDDDLPREIIKFAQEPPYQDLVPRLVLLHWACNLKDTDCVRKANTMFAYVFNNKIQQLLRAARMAEYEEEARGSLHVLWSPPSESAFTPLVLQEEETNQQLSQVPRLSVGEMPGTSGIQTIKEKTNISEKETSNDEVFEDEPTTRRSIRDIVEQMFETMDQEDKAKHEEAENPTKRMRMTDSVVGAFTEMTTREI